LRSGPEHLYYHADGSGNVTCLINANSVVVAAYEYDPFGGALVSWGPKAGLNPYRFSSKPVHEPSGMYDFLYRWYAPTLQRWVSRDPLQEQGDLNLYEFAFSAPITWVDPWGERCYWNPFDPETWAHWFGGDKAPAPIDPNSNRALLNDEGLTPSTLKDANGNEISGGKCTALVCGTVAAGALSAVTDGLGSLGRAESAAKEITAVRKAENALNKAKDIDKAQRKIRQGKLAGKIIDRTTKSEQNAKKLLRDIRNDPSCADDL
jgi:RHS repeat-associated protein